MFVVSGLTAWATHTVVRDQERRLLKERAGEVGLVFTSSLGTLTTSFDSLLAVLRATGATPAAFAKASAAQNSSTTSVAPTLALVRRQADGSFRVVAASGRSVKQGQLLAGARVDALRRAGSQKPTSTGVLGSGSSRDLGFALKATKIPGTSSDLYLYRETVLGKLSAGRQAGSAPFHEVDVVLYASPTVQPAQLLISTAGGAIPTSRSRFVAQPAGADTWLLGVRAKGSLVGSVASNAW